MAFRDIALVVNEEPNHNAAMDEQTPRSLKVGIGLLTAALWLAALASATYWVMRFMDRGQVAPANARELSLTPAPQALNWPSLAAHFGAEAKGPVVTDVRVLGIVLPKAGEKARAVLMIDSTKTTVVAEVGKEITEGPLAGAVIEQVTPTEVTLNRSAGNSQKLAVPDAKDARSAGLVTFNSNGNLPNIQPIASNIPGMSNIPDRSMPPPSPAATSIQAAARAAAQAAMNNQMSAPPPAIDNNIGGLVPNPAQKNTPH